MALRTLIPIVFAGLFFCIVSADIVVINDLIEPEEIFDFKTLADSDHFWTASKMNRTKYYCVFRNLWDEAHHPKIHALAAKPTNVVWNRETRGDTFEREIEAAGELVYSFGKGKGFFIDQDDNEENYAFLDGITVDSDFPFISGMAGINPSPDWFTGFYLLDSIDEFDRTFWNRIKIHTYPWDAGTDAGETYTSPDSDLDPPLDVERIFPQNAPDGIFVSPDGSTVHPVGEWECILHVCPDENDCERENWPPSNGCDVLKYPGCDEMCDPEVTSPCQQCQPRTSDNGSVFYPNCCESGYRPTSGDCDGNGSSASRTVFPLLSLIGGLFAASMS
ncbi:spondin like protein [Phaeodactylum tricornutum CCAP 1055/1]|uniref:Spondin like protein n=2 Tax=Phaeodactylum tricornutum TaxID=2850 RepID=B7G731_PHATC|nr:spondin like protein [Phaeodactylum tricornutum CCAP 1055/1]EEC45699.1 spondin like protein [Phaeodactylum tricornutum CCAP 1055/1]|eukprot:XP_002182963.1 spondin like protein [Phaeodactylum tricornutum CCAP 1055/1]